MGGSLSSPDLAPTASVSEVETGNPTVLAVSTTTTLDGQPILVDVKQTFGTVGGSGEEISIVNLNPSSTPSDDLITEDVDPSVFVSGRASINLDPRDSRKKKRCRCFCCKCKRRRRHSGTSGLLDHSSAFATDPSIHSQDDIVIPSEIFPLDMVASLEITPSIVAATPVKKRRQRVPEKPDKPLSLWSLIKNAIGKDLTRFPLPVNFSEPLSMLQRLAEDYEYSSILDLASAINDTVEQLAYVAVYTISAYASCAARTGKPFNPLLGETFEFDRTDDLGWRCIGEQVCHHPPVACLHCESAHHWVQWQQFTMSSKFRGNYIEIHPLGVAHLRFKNSDNHYTWRKATTVVRNLMLGKLYIDQEGEMDIYNHTTNERCHLVYSSSGWFSRDKSVSGKVFNSANVPKWEITGTWDGEVTATKLDSSGKPLPDYSRVLWRNKPLPSDAEKYYNFSTFTSQLNEPDDRVAPTDSRYRPDQRFMENGLWDEANLEKARLEDRQRELKKQREIEARTKLSTGSKLNTRSTGQGKMPELVAPQAEESGVEPNYTPCWFTRQRDPITGQTIHMYNGEYWECKEKQDWSRCPDLFK